MSVMPSTYATREPAAVIVDDFDTTVGEWEHSTTTVNHQQVLAQLMHLADSPTEAAGRRLPRADPSPAQLAKLPRRSLT